MTFQKGHKFAKGGKRPGAGPPTLAEREERRSFLAKLEAEREKRGSTLVAKYYAMAESDPATMRHLVDRVMPPAKQEFDISGDVGVDRELICALMLSKSGREAAEAVTKAITAARQPQATTGPVNGNGNGAHK